MKRDQITHTHTYNIGIHYQKADETLDETLKFAIRR